MAVIVLRCDWVVWLSGVIEWCDWMVWLNGLIEWCDWMVWLNGLIEWCDWVVWLSGTSGGGGGGGGSRDLREMAALLFAFLALYESALRLSGTIWERAPPPVRVRSTNLFRVLVNHLATATASLGQARFGPSWEKSKKNTFGIVISSSGRAWRNY